MLPDRVSNPGPLTYESGALPIALRGPACMSCMYTIEKHMLPFFSNGCVAVTIDFIRYLYAFSLKLYFFKTHHFIFI